MYAVTTASPVSSGEQTVPESRPSSESAAAGAEGGEGAPSARAVVGMWVQEAETHALPRRTGARAEQAWLRGRLVQARASGDWEAERDASVQLARALAARGTELDLATRLARRALVLGEDPQLREELSGWFAGLGEPGLAAATLRPAAFERRPEQAALVLTRIAVFEARAGAPEAAVDALREASQLASSDAVVLELLGAVGAHSPAALPMGQAADAYIEAARRRDARGERAPAFEDLLRAFELDPSSAIAAELLAGALAARGRAGAADEILREHALAKPSSAAATHLRRMREALARGELAMALAAGFDGGLDVELDPESAERATRPGGEPSSFDSLLAQVGLPELLAARLTLGAESLAGRAAAALWYALGRLYAGPLGAPERAVEAWGEALVADPSHEDAKASLRSHSAATRDHAPVVDALIRVARQPRVPSAPTEPVEACLRELMVMAEQRLSDPSLALWALTRLQAIGDDPELESARDRLRPRARLQQVATDNARAALEQATLEERPQALRRLLASLRFQPDRVDERIEILEELAASEPTELAWSAELGRLLTREQRLEPLEARLRVELGGAPRGDAERARLRLAELARRRGDLTAALAQLAPLVEAGTASRTAASMALMLAGRVGDQALRAKALLRLASPLPKSLRAVLCCAASEAARAADDSDAAWQAASAAREADPGSARAAAELARLALERRGADAAGAIEQALGLVVPRAGWCRALAEVLEASGELPTALAWTQRWLALRPGDPAAAAELLRRVTLSGSSDRLADALGWLLSQAQPMASLVPALAAALVRLAELDKSRAGGLARRALDVVGPRVPALREAILRVADTVGERGLGIAVRERELAAAAPKGVPVEEEVAILLDVADRRAEARDIDGAAGCLARAAAAGAPPREILRRVDASPPPRGSDGEIALLRARAEALRQLGEEATVARRRAERELGAALWDLASDHEGAIEAWSRAALLAPEDGILTFAQDLLTFAGAVVCVDRVRRFAEQIEEPSARARALGVAADVAVKAGDATSALALAVTSLTLDPRRGEVLAVVERAAGAAPADVEALETSYGLAAQAVLGRYGERAVHYRAAKNLERRGELRLALTHAVRAFEAVPAPGVTFVQMVRLAERAGDPLAALTALERASASSERDHERGEWLERAAMFSGRGEAGQRQRLEVLLRALAVRPEVEVLTGLGAAARELLALAPQERDVLELRLERALRALLKKLEAPTEARLALEAVSVALGSVSLPSLALDALVVAVSLDPSEAGYEELVPLAPELARAEQAPEWLADRAPSGGGAPLLALASAIATALEDHRAAARFLVEAGVRDPSRLDLLRRAEQAIAALPEEDRAALEPRLGEARSPEDRLEAWLRTAGEQVARGALVEARELLLQARPLADTAARRANVLLLLRQVYSGLGSRDSLLGVLSELAALPELEASARRGVVREQAALLATRGEANAAIRLLLSHFEQDSQAIELLTDVLDIAQQAGDVQHQLFALRSLSEQTTDEAARASATAALARLLEAQGDLQGARSLWAQRAKLAPDDLEALAAEQGVAEAQGDWDAVSSLMARRADKSSTSGARDLRLARVKLLDQQLGRSDEARRELEALLSEGGEDLEVVSALARLHERLGDQLRAAPLWLRASALASEKARASSLMRAACEAYLTGGDVDGARRVLDGLEVWSQSEDVRRLRVEVERRSQNPLALAEALEELALSSMAQSAERAALLVEAAEASERGGDLQLALARAQRAARIASDAATPQLYARYLEYRSRRAGGREDARVTLSELAGVTSELRPEQRELRAFLVAEAMDVLGDPDGALRELVRAHAEVGALPLLELGLAERLAARGEVKSALPLFEAALEGDLRALRRAGDVALMGARVALAEGRLEEAGRLLETASAQPESRTEALALQAELRERLAQGRSVPPEAPSPASVSQLFEEDAARSAAASEELADLPGASSAPSESLSGSPQSTPSGSLSSAPSALPNPPSSPPLRPSAPPSGSPSSQPSAKLPSQPPSASKPPSGSSKPSSAELPSQPPSAPPSAEAPSIPPTRPSIPDAPAAERAPSVPPPAPLPREEPGEPPPREEVLGPLPGAARPAILPPRSSRPPPPSSRASRPPKSGSLTTGSSAVSAPDSQPGSHSASSKAEPSRPSAPPSSGASASPSGAPPSSGAEGRRVSSVPPGSDLLRAAATEEAQPLSQEWRRSARSFAAHGTSEERLLEALEAGSVEAGRELIRQLRNRADRARDWVHACRLVSTLVPGDRWTLEQLYEATLADKDMSYARAIEHVLRAFDGGPQVEPPPLEAQMEEPERIHRMLFGESTGAAAEALALVWEGAGHVFRRDPTSYGVTGVERVPLHATTQLARAYGAAARILGVARTPLFQRRSTGAVTLSVVLLQPPSIILSGEVHQVTPALTFHLGAMLAATLPQYVLLFGSTEAQVSAILKGLGLAFGPPRAAPSGLGSAAILAETLWESVPPRAQRRLRELCDDLDALDPTHAMSAARLAIRRAGLFVSGDLRVALAEACAEEGIATRGIDAPGGLAALCAASPAVSDLVLLATSPEYAASRWRSPGVGQRPLWSTF
ncbi:MAG: hypothetical protein KF915_19940 [Polyangiaceae bacterium]|nr:hypothetical protein [Polyangiaceae bacterium]